MLLIRFFVVVTCTALFLCVPPQSSPALANGPLPAGLLKSFKALEELERCLEGRSWQHALTHLQELHLQIGLITREAGEKANENFLYHVGYSSGRLELALKNEDRNRSEDYFRDLLDLYLRFANSLTTEEPLTLVMIVKYIHEAEVWNGQSNFREVVFELKEIGRYFRNVYPVLEAKGVEHPEIWAFHGEVNQAMAAAEVGNAGATSSSLDRLEELAEGFRTLFDVTEARKAAVRP